MALYRILNHELHVNQLVVLSKNWKVLCVSGVLFLMSVWRFSFLHIMFSTVIPPKPIRIARYLCDKKFHTEFVIDLFEEHSKIGIMMVKGTECSFHLKEGTSLQTIFRKGTQIVQNHGMGGQSSQRYSRKHLGAVLAYLKYMEEKLVELDKRFNIERIYIVGNADKKGKLLDRLETEQSQIFKKCTGITVNGDATPEDIAKMVENNHEISAKSKENCEIMSTVEKLLETCPERVRFGKKEIESAIMVSKNLQTLIISDSKWNSWSIERRNILKEKLSECGANIFIIDGKIKSLNTMFDGMVGVCYNGSF